MLARIGKIFIGAVVLLLLFYAQAQTSEAATIVVNSPNDDIDGADGECTLREAIAELNAGADTTNCNAIGTYGDNDQINFDAVGPINPGTTLTIIRPVFINGFTPSGTAAPADCFDGTATRTELTGAVAGPGVPGLYFGTGSDGSTVQGLVIRNFGSSHGIVIDEGNNITIHCNFIGTDAAGTAIASNGGSGISAQVSTGHIITNNLISGNNFAGITLVSTTNTRIEGNRIGTNRTGTAAIRNLEGGITLIFSSNGQILDNLISGNQHTIDFNGGLFLVNSSNNTVQGNFIGTTLNGTAALGNISTGIHIFANSGTAQNNLIGGLNPGDGNLIAGNDTHGILLRLTGSPSTLTNTTIQGNYIGTNAAGTADLGNTENGILIEAGVTNTLIGGSTAAARNIISGNNTNGVSITGGGATNTRIQGNYIGTNAAGTVDLGNSQNGIFIQAGVTNTLIGGSTAAARNIISGNNLSGVAITGTGASNNLVQGNYIGLNAAGTGAIPNTSAGVAITLAATANIIGTNGDGVNDAGEGNVIARNGLNNVYLAEAGTQNNRVAGNLIGTNAAGTAALGNTSGQGVLLHRAANNNIIGTNGDGVSDALERNVVVGSAEHGIRFADGATTGNVAAGNYVGVDITGTVALGNTLSGIAVDFGSGGNRVGTNSDGVSDALEGNLVSGNPIGIKIGNPGISNNNIVAGNYVGVSSGGTALPNTGNGISIATSSANNLIGGTSLIARNLVAYNGTNGLENQGTNTTIQFNYFLDNTQSGILLSDGSIFLNTSNCLVQNGSGMINNTVLGTTAENNWWGVDDGPSGSGPGTGDSVSTLINFDPWLVTPLPDCLDLTIPPTPTPTPTSIPVVNAPVATAPAEAPGVEVAQAQIFIIKQVDKTLAAIGDTVTYTITFTNPKGNTLNNVIITDAFDARLTSLRVVSTSLGTATFNGNTLTLQGFSLLPGQQATLVVTAQISSQARGGDVIANFATLESPDASIHVSNTVTVTILPATLPATGETPLLALVGWLLLIMGSVWIVNAIRQKFQVRL